MKTRADDSLTTKRKIFEVYLDMFRDYKKTVEKISKYLHSVDPKEYINVDDSLEKEEYDKFEAIREYHKKHNLEKMGLKLKRPFGESLDYFKFNLKKKKVFIDDLEAILNLNIGDIKKKLIGGKNLDSSVTVKDNPIYKITFINGGTIDTPRIIGLYINDNKDEVKKIKSLSKAVRDLAKLAKNANPKTKTIPYNKNTIDYINTNSNCVIYCRGKYDLTKIISYQGGVMFLSTDIQCKITSNRVLKLNNS